VYEDVLSDELCDFMIDLYHSSTDEHMQVR
jgi:hypothetical protein